MLNDKAFLDKFKSPTVDKKDYERTLFYLFRKLGYEETLKLPIPVFIGIVKNINETEGSKEEDAKHSKH